MEDRVEEILKGFKDYLIYYDNNRDKDKYSIYNYILKPEDMIVLIEYIGKLRNIKNDH